MKRCFYEKLNIKCEGVYNKACNLTDEEKGKYKDRDNYIFNYIYDTYGFRIGVIVCFMNKEKNLPKIGWSLMRELTVGEPNILIEKPYDIPTFRALVDNNSVNSKMYKLYTFIRDVKEYKIDGFPNTFSGMPNTVILNRKQRDMLIDIAIARAVTYTPELSKNYYCNNNAKGLIKFEPYNEDDDYITDIRNNQLVITGNAFIQNKSKESICKKIRDAVRAMEYRAWKYYKYEEKSPYNINSLPTINLSYKGYDFPMIKMGHRTEGDIYGSLYLTSDLVPFSPVYEGDKYDCGCKRWSISIVRQWLNSDKPAGEWFKEYKVDGYKVNWKETPYYTKNFIQNTDGFLKIVGLSKSQLTPVKNITYTTEGDAIITEDYVWIPSLTELSIHNNYKEGKPLEYWKTLLSKNVSTNHNRTIKTCDTLRNMWYWTRPSDSSDACFVNYIDDCGYLYWEHAYRCHRMPVLACFKSN